MAKKSILDFPISDWPDLMEKLGDKAFRSKQIAQWIFKKRVKDFNAMTDLSEALRKKLNENYVVRSLELDRVEKSEIDGTSRVFFKTQDDQMVSCVYLPYKDRNSLCISTQVGCAWGCVFCASGRVKFQRNLSPAEILDQIFIVEAFTEKPLDSLLFMGMGEPLGAYASLVPALYGIRSEFGFNFGSRHVTVSTCGLVPQIEKLASEAPKVNLAISLHAAFDEKRKEILPKSSKWSIKELMNAAKTYSMKTKSRVTFEYILLDGINDTEQDAKRLANLLRGPAQKGDYWVNLIAYNPVPGLPYKKPDESKMDLFKRILEDRHVPVMLRKPQGVDISAGCGQLGEAR